jgi:tetratricopeptide (TPR) repeat protein
MKWDGLTQIWLAVALMLYLSTAPAIAVSPNTISPGIESTPEALGQAVNKLFDQAFEATSHGDFKSAETLWTEILARYPNNAAVWSNRGNARVSQRKLPEAIADYNQSIALAPDQPDPYLNRGTALEGLQQWDAAIADYNQVLAIDPKDPAAFNNRGNAKAGAAAELNPGFAMAQANCALAQYQLGQTDASMRRFRNLVRKYPQFADMRAAFAAALWTQGQRGEAESQWVSVVGLDARYRDLDWVRTIRRWPPHLVDALAQFLSLQNNS